MATCFRGHLVPVLAALVLAACSSPGGAGAGAQHAAMHGGGGMRGYGVPGVDGPTLQAMLGRCEGVEPVPPEKLAAIPQTDIRRSCDQLRRTRSTQPGNTVRTERRPATAAP